MPLHLRRYNEVWPYQDWSADQHLVITDQGYGVGTIQPGNHLTVRGRVDGWTWAINGEIVTPDEVRATGAAETLDEAKTALAENWRRWLALKGLGEDHVPFYGAKLSIETRRRLRLPVS
jgi:hypothetical protein